MSNYCNKCKVELESSVSHCPLCGKCVNETLIGKQILHENFPTEYKYQKDKKQAMQAIAYLLIFGNFVSLFLELMLFAKITFSIQLVVGSVFAFFGVIVPIKNNWSLVNYHSVFYVAVTLYIIFLENYTNSFGWGIVYVIPLFVLAFSVYNFLMILSNRNNRTEYILPMFILTTIATVAFSYNYFSGLVLWPSLSAFLATVAFVNTLFVFRSSKILKPLAKKLHF